MRKKILLTLLVLFVAIIGGIGYLASTEAGLRWVFAKSAGLVPGEISAQSLDGRLAGPIAIRGLSYNAEDLRIHIDELLIDWDPVDLFALRVHLTQLEASGLTVTSRGGDDGSPSKVELPDIRLPVKIEVDGARIEGLTVEDQDDGSTFTVTRVSLGARGAGDLIRIRHLRVESHLVTVSVEGEIRPRRDYPLEIAVDWNLKPPGYSPLRGSGTLSGSLRELHVTQEILAPRSAKLSGTIEDALGEIRWKASLALDQLHAQNVNESWPPVTLTARLGGSGNLAVFDLSGSFTASEPGYGDISGQFLARNRNGAWMLDRLLLNRPGTDLEIMVSGHYTSTGARPTFSVAGEWKQFTWPLDPKEASLVSPEGKLKAKGAPDDYSFSAETRLLGEEIPEGRWALEGKGNLKEIHLGSLKATILAGDLSGRGMVRWEPETAWRMTLEGNGIDPGAMWDEWGGRVDFNIRSEGSIAEGKPEITLTIDRVKGQLRGYPLDGAGDLYVSGNRYTLSRLEIHSGKAMFAASGGLSETWSLKWEVDAPDLSEILPGGKGSLKGKGEISGHQRMPAIRASLRGKDIAVKTAGAKEALLDLKLDLQDAGESRIDVEGREVTAGPRKIDAFALRGSGKMAAHNLLLTVKSAGETLRLELAGRYGDRYWEGELEGVDLSSPHLGDWALLKPETVSLSPAKIQTGDLCLVRDSSRLCLKSEWEGEKGLQAQASIVNIPLGLLGYSLPENLNLAGHLNGKAEVSYRDDDSVKGEITLDVSPGSISYTADDDRDVQITFQGGNFDARLDESELTATLDISLMEEDGIKGSLTLPRFSPGEIRPETQELAGHAHVRLKESGLIPALFEELTNTAGTMKAQLEFSGTLARPLITGELALDNVAADISTLGIRIEDTRLSASSDGSGIISFDGEARSNQGTLRIKGTTRIDPRRDLDASIEIKGQSFEVLKTPQLWCLLSPDLAVRLRGNSLNVEGEVTIPEATIEPRDLSGAVSPSKDAVVVSEAGKEKDEGKLSINARVRLTLGDKVTFDGFGLTGHLSGSVLAVEEPETLTTGTGELRILDGKYEAYGQKLDIQRGRAIFAGGLIEDPFLDVRAVRTIGEVVAGVEVTGTVKSPKTSLFSSPVMDQGDVLSYLLLGKPLTGASSSEGQKLQAAALTAGLSGGEFLARDIGSQFGLDEVAVEQGQEDEGASVVLGKYLSPKLYVGYGVGLFEPISTYRIRYHISSKWLVQTEHGTETGADLFYRIEK